MAGLPQLPFTSLFSKHLVLAGLICLVFSLIWPNAWLTCVLGAVIALLPQIAFALIAFRYRGARQQQKFMRSLFLATGVKLGLTVVLFALVFLLVQPSNPISLLCTYIAVVLLNWLNPWLMPKKAAN